MPKLQMGSPALDGRDAHPDAVRARCEDIWKIVLIAGGRHACLWDAPCYRPVRVRSPVSVEKLRAAQAYRVEHAIRRGIIPDREPSRADGRVDGALGGP